MAVIDRDHGNFSNVSWHSDQAGTARQASTQTSREQAGNSAELSGPRVDEQTAMDHHIRGAHAGGDILECTVSKPHKENDGTKDAYVSYLITTTTTFSTFQKPTTTVRRRFTDFVFLYKTLSKEYQGAAVPPLPDKQRMEYVRGDRFRPEFTARRAWSLQRFLQRLALHPELRRVSFLHQFLESPDWNATMRSRSARGSGSPGADSVLGVTSPTLGAGGGGSGGSGGGGGGVFDSLADSFMNAFTKPHKTDPQYVELKERSDKLDEDLNHVEKVVARVARREMDLETDLKDLAEQFQRLITLEPGIEAPLHAFAASVEDTAAGLRRLREHTDLDYLGSLREMVAYSAALKTLLKAREQKQLDHEQLSEYLHKSTTDRDALATGSHGGYYGSGLAGPLGGAGGFLRSKLEDVRGVDHEQSRRDRQRKLELRIQELTSEVEAAGREQESFSNQVTREADNFEWIKRVEFKRELGGLADAHVDFYSGVMEIWERYVQEMEREGVVLSA